MDPVVTLHGLRACDACRRAMRDLAAAGVPARLRDLRAEPPDATEVARWLDALGPALLNRRSTTWRSLSEAVRGGDPAALMAAHPTLVKRPVVALPDGRLWLGWTAEARAAAGL